MNSKVAIITGGSGGIGTAIAKALSKRGYSTAIIYNTNEKSTLALQSELKNSIAIKCDVSSEPEVRKMVSEVIEKMGGIDVLVNSASPPLNYSRFIEKDMKLLLMHMNVSYFGAVNCIKHVLPHMAKQRSGSIINILSQNVISSPQPGFSDYICAKYALLGLTKCLAVEYACKNIRVNAVSPGMVETNMLKSLPPKTIELAREAAPLGRLTSADDVASAILFLISDEASGITGINLPVCGGSAF